MFSTIKYPLEYTATPDDEKYLGSTCFFPNISQYFASTDAMRGFAAWCIARWVVNKSGGTLAKGLRVLHHNNATYVPGVAVAGAAGADVEFAGFVNPFMTATTVADGYGFWLITEGFTKVGYDGSANFAIRDNLSGAASGWCSEATENYTDPWIIGKALEAKTSGSAGDLISAFVKMPFA